MATFDRAAPLDAIATIVEQGTLDVDRPGETTEDGRPAHEARGCRRRACGPSCATCARRIDELNPLVYREGPHTILERYLERTGQVLDLIAADTLESKRTVANIASFVRFAADWQRANPNGTLAGSWTTWMPTRRPAASCRRASSCPRTPRACGS